MLTHPTNHPGITRYIFGRRHNMLFSAFIAWFNSTRMYILFRQGSCKRLALFHSARRSLKRGRLRVICLVFGCDFRLERRRVVVGRREIPPPAKSVPDGGPSCGKIALRSFVRALERREPGRVLACIRARAAFSRHATVTTTRMLLRQLVRLPVACLCNDVV